jgi:predicted membrane metal-binding protein
MSWDDNYGELTMSLVLQGSDGKRYRTLPKSILIIIIFVIFILQFAIHYFFHPQYYSPYCIFLPITVASFISIFILFYPLFKMIELDRSDVKKVGHRILSWERNWIVYYSYYEQWPDSGGIIRYSRRSVRILNIRGASDVFIVPKGDRIWVIAPPWIIKWIAADPSIKFKEIKDIPKLITADPEITL